MADPIAYKVLLADEMARLEADGRFAGAPVDLADGYIHLSTAAQLDETVAKHFAGKEGLFVAAVDLSAFGDALRWEPSRGGALFPHLYAVLTLDSVVAYGPLERDEDGAIRLPVAG
ncbi:DUF952 domain-containing protein [Sphingomonas histidinilytica]|uniref:Uncharacterized conserved protein, DUF952 family n=1 Tax=Rhizorhabdus histidinilytica TaxID=439228 RepID=A0A1T5EBR5_9SPHN|nr:DUF952 domain-containing protein [Rhizorhabdus histidinilytica]MBO9378568.1 DUF952 domain-containing protein [Rhizorhabdus histidinilytica]SKB81343.1 Uncharacterized conserved protein, DUF952 family [Rhizorhabdus histidinilytica]